MSDKWEPVQLAAEPESEPPCVHLEPPSDGEWLLRAMVWTAVLTFTYRVTEKIVDKLF